MSAEECRKTREGQQAEVYLKGKEKGVPGRYEKAKLFELFRIQVNFSVSGKALGSKKLR